jgi:hypothetical protein
MSAEVTPHTLCEIAEDYESAVAWVNSIGFTVDRGRIAEYHKVITDLVKGFEANGLGNLEDSTHRERVYTALLEVRELVSIHRGLAVITDAQATTGLKHYLKGPFLPTDELARNASNRPRNIGFELYLNALFAYAGFRPTYNTTADLSFECMSQKFFVEAKRPTNAEAVEELITDANKQLLRQLKKSGNHKAMGLIALDLTKVINPESKVMPVFNEDHLHCLMYNEDKRQIERLSPSWHRRRHPRTVGVLLHYRLLTNFVPTGALSTLKWIGFVKLRDEPTLTEITAKLETVVRLIC